MPPLSARASPARFAALHSRPLTLREGGLDSCLRRDDVVAPLRPGHTPLTAFAPLSSGTKGAYAAMPRLWVRCG